MSLLRREERRRHCPPDKCYPCGIPYLSVPGKKVKIREVPAFSLQANRQSNVRVEQFQKKSVIKPYPVGNTPFKRYYLRGDFPIALEFTSSRPQIAWKVNLKDLDYSYYLPVFFTGLCEVEYPYQYLAQKGIEDMLTNGKEKILPVLPDLITPIKNALNTRNSAVIGAVLKTLQVLVTSSDRVGEAMVPYYRQILLPLNLYRNMNVNIGDEIDYGQQRRENIGELVQETLELLETYGGPYAFINIKYMVPTYQSCVHS